MPGPSPIWARPFAIAAIVPLRGAFPATDVPLMSHLFTPLRIRDLEFRNRVFVSPMCQYSSPDGRPSDWHVVHLGSRAVGGAGLVLTEATAVSPEGRISPDDTGIWTDAQAAAWRRVTDFVRGQGAAVGIQLAHAGRKASTPAPWQGDKALGPGERGWQPIAPSAVAFSEASPVPSAMSEGDIDRVVGEFAEAARRSLGAGFQVVEVHAAHGYLLHQFLSPLANRRTDEYGGSLENRMRVPLEVFRAVRAAFPPDRPVWARLSATDWVDGGWDLDSSVAFARALEEAGSAAIHVSTGGVSPQQKIAPGAGYQVPFAARIKAEVGLPTIAVGLITEPEQAETIVASGEADAVALARAMLFDPRWPWHAAAKLGAKVRAPKQYWRSQPREYKDLFEGAAVGQR